MTVVSLRPGNNVKNSKNEWVELITSSLESLREEILALEKELARYGFDPRRGIESYKISELRELLVRAGDRANEVKQLLLQLVNLQEKLYRQLYELVGLKELNVDTDTPEKRLLTIKEWLLTGNTRFVATQSKFKHALAEISKILTTCTDNCEKEILAVLSRMYKRDYDRYRVLKFIVDACMELRIVSREEASRLEHKSIPEIVKIVMTCASRLGKEKLAKVIEVRGEFK